MTEPQLAEQQRQGLKPSPSPSQMQALQASQAPVAKASSLTLWIWGGAAVLGALALAALVAKRREEYAPNPAKRRAKRKAAPKRRRAGGRCPVGTQVQTLIFDRRRFNAAEARSWAKKHGYASGYADTAGPSVRIRQVEPGRFTKSSFRTIALTSGVQAVVGCPKRAKRNPETRAELRKIALRALIEKKPKTKQEAQKIAFDAALRTGDAAWRSPHVANAVQEAVDLYFGKY